MRHRHLLRTLLVLIMSLAGMLLATPCRAEYDPAAEIQRLIDKAVEERQKAQDALLILKASREKMKQQFLFINETDLALANNLRRIRMIDARNKAMLVVTTGLNITAINAPEKMAEIGTSLAVDLSSEYLRNNYPKLFDSSVTVELPKLGLNSVAEMREFNKTMSMNDKEIEKRIFDEDPKFAEYIENRGWLKKTLSGDKLSDELISLKRAEFMVKDGTRAEQALKALKQELLNKQHDLLQAIAGLEHEIRRLDDAIHSWKRQLEMQGVLKSANEWSKEPDPVTFSADPDYDFGTASSKMKDAWQKLAGGQYSCRSYHNAMWDATKGAQTQLNKQVNAIYAALKSCGYTEACWARASAAAASVYRAYESQVQGTAKQQREEAKALADGPIHSFGQKLNKWDQNEVDMIIWGEDHAVKMKGQHGDWLGMAIWQYALADYAVNSVSSRFYPMSLKRLAQSEKILQEWQDDAKSLKEYFQKRANSAQNSAAMVGALASTTTEMAGALQPNIELWDCFRSEGSYGYDPAMVSFENVRYQYDRLSHFEAAFTGVSRNGEEAGAQLIERASKNVELTNKVVEALRSAVSVKGVADRLVASAKELRAAQEGNLDVSGGQIYTILSHYDISESGLKALSERIDGLSDPEALEKEALAEAMRLPGAPYKNRVLNKEGIESVKATVIRQLASIDSARDRYAKAHRDTLQAESSLDAALRDMRDKLEPIFPEEVPYFLKEAVLREYREPDDYLALVLRDRIGPANELPDSGLGSGPLIERYATLAARYHALVDPMMPVARANRYAPEMEEMLKKLQADAGRLGGLDNAAFSRESNRYSNEAYRLITQAGNEGRVEPKSRINVAYGALINKLSAIAFEYYQRQRLSRAQSSLQSAIDSINRFLGNPDAMGGWQAAQSWMDSIPATKGAVDTSVRGHSAIVPLLAQLDGLMERLKIAAANVDSGTLQRDTQAIRSMYADFASAYQNRNMPGLIHFLSSDWQAADGSNVYDLETTLGNSFRVFDSIVFKISGMSIQRTGNFYQVSYQAALTGRISRMQKSHEETSNVVDTVVITPDGPRIQKTTAMLH